MSKESFSIRAGSLVPVILISLMLCSFGCKFNLFGKKTPTVVFDNSFTITLYVNSTDEIKPFLNPENMDCIQAVMERQAGMLGVETTMEIIHGCLHPRLIRVKPRGQYDYAKLTKVFTEAGKIRIIGEEMGEILTGQDLKEVSLIQHIRSGSLQKEPAIQLEFPLEVVPHLKRMTKANLGKNLTIELDNRILLTTQVHEIIQNQYLILHVEGETTQTIRQIYALINGAMYCNRATISITNLQ